MIKETPIESIAGQQRFGPGKSRGLARLVLVAFLLTFMASRVLVYLIMSRRIPDLYAHVRGTHVHHLNYGIFLLSIVAGYLLFRRPTGGMLNLIALLYGVGLALTFDEFGMWLHLGGSYWQRASFDAVAVIAGLLMLIGFAPSPKMFSARHWVVGAIIAIFMVVFFALLVESFDYASRMESPKLERIEAIAPT